MKYATLLVISSAVLLLASGLLASVFPISSAYAQVIPSDLSAAATEVCTRSAESKGFQAKDIVSVEPKAGTDGANVVLTLDRTGQAYKLTCRYSKLAGDLMGDDTAANETTPNLFSLWWLLLPLLGLPLLLAWVKNRDRNLYQASQERSEAFVKHEGKPLSIYSGPDESYAVTSVLHNGQRIVLSGRRSDDWAELAYGG